MYTNLGWVGIEFYMTVFLGPRIDPKIAYAQMRIPNVVGVSQRRQNIAQTQSCRCNRNGIEILININADSITILLDTNKRCYPHFIEEK